MKKVISIFLILILVSCSKVGRFGTGVDVTFDPRTIGMYIDDKIMEKNPNKTVVSFVSKLYAKDDKNVIIFPIKNDDFNLKIAVEEARTIFLIPFISLIKFIEIFVSGYFSFIISYISSAFIPILVVLLKCSTSPSSNSL